MRLIFFISSIMRYCVLIILFVNLSLYKKLISVTHEVNCETIYVKMWLPNPYITVDLPNHMHLHFWTNKCTNVYVHLRFRLLTSKGKYIFNNVGPHHIVLHQWVYLIPTSYSISFSLMFSCWTVIIATYKNKILLKSSVIAQLQVL